MPRPRVILHLYPLQSAAERAFAQVNGAGVKNRLALRINYPDEVHLYRSVAHPDNLTQLQGYAFDLVDFCGHFPPDVKHRVLQLKRSD